MDGKDSSLDVRAIGDLLDEATAGQRGGKASSRATTETFQPCTSLAYREAMALVRDRMGAALAREREAVGAYERHAQHADAAAATASVGEWGAVYAVLRSRLGSGMLVGLCGTRGNGKTQMGVCLCYDAVARSQTARYRRACDILDSIRATYGDSGEGRESEVMDDVTGCRLLVIDEWQERRDTAFEDRILTQIIDERYGAGRDTLLISNLGRRAFLEALGESIADRMRECGGIVEATWRSFRGS